MEKYWGTPPQKKVQKKRKIGKIWANEDEMGTFLSLKHVESWSWSKKLKKIIFLSRESLKHQ